MFLATVLENDDIQELDDFFRTASIVKDNPIMANKICNSNLTDNSFKENILNKEIEIPTVLQKVREDVLLGNSKLLSQNIVVTPRN